MRETPEAAAAAVVIVELVERVVVVVSSAAASLLCREDTTLYRTRRGGAGCVKQDAVIYKETSNCSIGTRTPCLETFVLLLKYTSGRPRLFIAPPRSLSPPPLPLSPSSLFSLLSPAFLLEAMLLLLLLLFVSLVDRPAMEDLLLLLLLYMRLKAVFSGCKNVAKERNTRGHLA